MHSFAKHQPFCLLCQYVEHLFYILTYINLPQKNGGNSAAGHCMLLLLSTIQGKNVPVEFVKVHNNPNGSFQNGIPNPILHENQADSIQAE